MQSKLNVSSRTYVAFVGSMAALGGLLFGYDTGVISGAQGFLKQEFQLTPTTQEIAVSSVLAGTIIGAACAGKLADWLGRRMTLIVMAVVFGVGAILTALSPDLPLFIIFRILVGFGIGAASVVSPIFTSELAPPAVRGKLVFLFQLAITFGILVAYVIDMWFAQAGFGWRPMFGVAVVPALILGGGMLFLSDTPRWYASKGRWDEARKVMAHVAGKEADPEVERIRSRLQQERQSSVHELFRGGLRLALLAGFGLAVLQQFVGINTIIYYAPIVTGYSGIATSSQNGSLIGATIVGIVNFLTTIVAVTLVDKVGRRKLLLAGTGGILVTLAVLGVLFLFNAQQLGVLILIFILLYIVSFAIGMGPAYWLMSAELFPTRLRGTGSSISTIGNWSANLLVSVTFLTLINAVGRSVTFWIYAAWAVIALFFIWNLIPETRNKPLEDIEEYWENDRVWPDESEASSPGEWRAKV